MNLSISYQKHDTYNCYDENIVSILCHSYKRDIDLYFLNDFGFKSDDSSVGNDPFTISTNCGISMLLMDEYMGIKIKRVRKEEFNYLEFKNILIKEIHNIGFLGVSLDAYDCPWNKKYYRIIHMNHYSMITEVDEDRCICQDPYFGVNQYMLPSKELYEIIDSILVFSIHKKKNEYKTIGSICKNALLAQRDIRMFEIKKFAQNMLEQDVDVLYESVNGDIGINPMVFSVNGIYKARCNFRDSIIQYNEILGISSAIQEKLNILCKKWERVQSLCIMAIYKKSSKYLTMSSNLLYEIAKDEKNIIDDFCIVWR